MKRVLAICAMSAFLLAACGDDESSGFTTRPDEDSSSSVCEDCDDSSSSKVKSSSSKAKSSSSKAKSSSSKDVSSKSSSSKGNGKSSSSVKPKSSDSETSVSSSSSAKSSSSKNGDAKSSSSSAESLSSDASSISFFEDEVTGTMTDGRDGQTYKIVKIGRQIWMAENLNYAYIGVPYIYTETNTSDSSSWCYDNDPANCTKYGRLYTWSAAMDSVGRWSTNGKGCGDETTCSPTYPVRGVCPEGWHLPTELEWGRLFILDGYTSTAAERLKSTSGWTDNGNGSDIYSFAVLPAGIRYANGGYAGEGGYAIFWTSDSDDDYYADAEAMSYDSNGVGRYGLYKQEGYSVRCVKD